MSDAGRLRLMLPTVVFCALSGLSLAGSGELSGQSNGPHAPPNTAYSEFPASRGVDHARRPGSGPATMPARAVIKESGEFLFFDGTAFLRKPELAREGLHRIYVTDREMFLKDDRQTPDEAATRLLARRVAALGQPLVLDIEHWPVDIRKATDQQVQESLNKLICIVDWVHDERPEVQVGFYGLVPLGDYWSPVNYLTALEKGLSHVWWRANLLKFRTAYDAWKAANDRLRPLAEKVDFLAPSLYTFYEDRDGWKKYATASMQEARRFGKPVLPFIWMDYHDGTPLKGRSLPAGYWQMQLDTVREHGNGVVIWGGWRAGLDGKAYRQRWDKNAEWWVTLKSFIDRQQH